MDITSVAEDQIASNFQPNRKMSRRLLKLKVCKDVVHETAFFLGYTAAILTGQYFVFWTIDSTFGREMRAESAAFRSEIRADSAAFRSEMRAIDAAIRSDNAAFRSEWSKLNSDISGLLRNYDKAQWRNRSAQEEVRHETSDLMVRGGTAVMVH